VERPVVWAKVLDAAGTLRAEAFLIDPGADRTVFSADLLTKLQLPTIPTPEGMGLEGVGGGCAFVVVETVVRLPRDDGEEAKSRASLRLSPRPRRAT
jgi:hypothetical protein